MPLLRVSGFSTSDLNQDQPPHTLGVSVLSGGRNFNYAGTQLQKSLGYVAVYGSIGTTPRFALAGKFGLEPWLLVAGTDKIYSMSYAAWANETGSLTLAATEKDGWSGDILHGLAVLTNGVNNPVFFDGSTLATLTNWPPADTTTCLCRTLRSYKNFLVAGYVTEDGTAYPQVVRWSHGADPGAVPSSWDATDETKDAGRKALSETSGYVVDSLTLGDVQIIYKDDSTYIMQYIGGAFIFRFTLLSSSSGIMNKNCAVDIGGAHIVLTQNDVVMVTQQTIKSIANNRVRRTLFGLFSITSKERCFVAHDYSRKEVHICFSDGNSTWANKDYVWNYSEDKWQLRDLPGLSWMLAMGQQEIGETFDGSTGTINSDSNPIDDVFSSLNQFVGLDYSNSRLLALNSGNTENGTLMVSEVYHESYDFAAEQGVDKVKLITKVRPHFSPSTLAGTVINISIGTQMELGDAISWGTAQAFTVGTTRDVYFRANGRYISWKVSSDTDCAWGLEGLDIDFRFGGVY